MSLGVLFGGFVFGVIGIALVRDGKITANLWHALIGMGLMIYPWFIFGGWAFWLIGIVLIGAAWVTRGR